MRATEGRQEVIQCILVGHINGRQVEVRLEMLLVEDVLFANRRIEQVARRNALRVMIVVARSRSRDIDQVGCEL